MDTFEDCIRHGSVHSTLLVVGNYKAIQIQQLIAYALEIAPVYPLCHTFPTIHSKTETKLSWRYISLSHNSKLEASRHKQIRENKEVPDKTWDPTGD